jgi:hypothetical protein
VVVAYPPGFDPPDRSRGVARLSEAGQRPSNRKKKEKKIQQNKIDQIFEEKYLMNGLQKLKCKQRRRFLE